MLFFRNCISDTDSRNFICIYRSYLGSASFVSRAKIQKWNRNYVPHGGKPADWRTIAWIIQICVWFFCFSRSFLYERLKEKSVQCYPSPTDEPVLLNGTKRWDPTVHYVLVLVQRQRACLSASSHNSVNRDDVAKPVCANIFARAKPTLKSLENAKLL